MNEIGSQGGVESGHNCGHREVSIKKQRDSSERRAPGVLTSLSVDGGICDGDALRIREGLKADTTVQGADRRWMSIVQGSQAPIGGLGRFSSASLGRSCSSTLKGSRDQDFSYWTHRCAPRKGDERIQRQ